MSLVTSGTFLNVVLADAAGNKSNLRIALGYADLAALSAAVTAGDIDGFLTDLNAVTDARVVSYAYGEGYGEDADFFGAADSEVEALALITSLIDGEPTKSHNLRIPAPADGIFLGVQGANRNIIDVADADLQAYLANFAAAGIALVSDGEQIADPTVAGNFKGKRIHRASTKG